jgi:hypothetical protein
MLFGISEDDFEIITDHGYRVLVVVVVVIVVCCAPACGRQDIGFSL